MDRVGWDGMGWEGMGWGSREMGSLFGGGVLGCGCAGVLGCWGDRWFGLVVRAEVFGLMGAKYLAVRWVLGV